jgi:hypothetical protein
MRQQEIPSVGLEQWCSSGKDGKEVIFKYMDGVFGCVAAVDVGWDQLQGAVIVGNGLLEGCAGFIVYYVEFRLAACGGEPCKDVGVGSNVKGILFGFKWVEQDGIGISVEGNHDVLVAAVRAWGEASHVI